MQVSYLFLPEILVGSIPSASPAVFIISFEITPSPPMTYAYSAVYQSILNTITAPMVMIPAKNAIDNIVFSPFTSYMQLLLLLRKLLSQKFPIQLSPLTFLSSFIWAFEKVHLLGHEYQGCIQSCDQNERGDHMCYHNSFPPFNFIIICSSIFYIICSCAKRSVKLKVLRRIQVFLLQVLSSYFPPFR